MNKLINRIKLHAKYNAYIQQIMFNELKNRYENMLSNTKLKVTESNLLVVDWVTYSGRGQGNLPHENENA